MLLEKLQQLAVSDCYPFHMPGHKRMQGADFPNPYSIDITEIENFDNLHHPREILKEEQERVAEIYGSRQCFYLINGSTCGLLAAISAATRPGDSILVARNCHKAVYNAMYLRQLTPVYVYPAHTRSGLQGQIWASDVEKKLTENPGIKAVVITSPTYDGLVSDVEAIADVAHRRGIPLIVDEAHGAHFGFHEAFPENAVKLHADAVIMSVHKTLPAFTQTALLHLCSDRIDGALLQRFLGIYESSSPSYILMAGISRCMDMVTDASGREKFQEYVKMLEDFRRRMEKLRHLRVLGAEDFDAAEAYAYDKGKIIIDAGDSGMSGQQLKEWLLKRCNLELEMASGSYALAMTSLMDTREGFDRLALALEKLDSEVDQKQLSEKPVQKHLTPEEIYREQERGMELWKAVDEEHEAVSLAEAEGRISGNYIYLYPPGIPILAPGEKIDGQSKKILEACLQMELDVEGLAPGNAIEVVKI